MTQPDREELAGRKSLMLAMHQWVRDDTNTALKMVITPAMLEKLVERIEAAAALRQSPTVEEVRAVLEDTVDAELAGPCENRAEVVAESLDAAAQAVASLYRGSKE